MISRSRALAVTAAAVVLSLTAACGDAGEPPATSTPAQPTISPPPSRDPSPPATTSTPTALEPTPSAEDLALIRSFVSFAKDPSPDTAAAVGFADDVRLGLSRDLMATLDASTLPQRPAWSLDKPAFRGYVGPFSALDLIRQHADQAGSATVRRTGGAFAVSSGAHPHCASPPVAAPRGYTRHQRVSVQPSQATTDGCLAWFTVDLFLDRRGQVAAVTLDLWEP